MALPILFEGMCPWLIAFQIVFRCTPIVFAASDVVIRPCSLKIPGVAM